MHRSRLGRHDDGSLLADRHGQGPVRGLVAEHVDLALQLVDLGLSVIDPLLYGQRLADRRRLGQQGEVVVAGLLQRVDVRLQVDVAGGHVLACGGGRRRDSEGPRLGRRGVERPGAHAQDDRSRRSGPVLSRRRARDVTTEASSQSGQPVEHRRDLPLGDGEPERAGVHDLGRVRSLPARSRLPAGLPPCVATLLSDATAGQSRPEPERCRRLLAACRCWRGAPPALYPGAADSCLPRVAIAAADEPRRCPAPFQTEAPPAAATTRTAAATRRGC